MHSLLLAALITVVPAQAQFGKRITVLVDVSGSLSPHRQQALDAALEVIQLTATDETEIRIRVFGGASLNLVDPDGQVIGVHTPHTEWLPWPVDLAKARQWIAQHTPLSSTMTVLHPAWEAALAEGDVVLVTDGLIDDAARIQRPRGRTVGVVLVGGPGTTGVKFACAVANGGVYRVQPEPVRAGD